MKKAVKIKEPAPALLPVQIEAVEKIESAFAKNIHKGFILADIMGLGKTASAISVARRKNPTKDAPVIIIVPAFLLYNWIDELTFWGINIDDVCVIDSGKQTLKETPYYLVGYSRVINPLILAQLLKKKYSLIVCDEGHYLKAWNSRRSNVILGNFRNVKSNLLYRANNILLLTGTPILNRIEELYNIVIRIAPKTLDLMSKYQFFQIYAGWIENTGFQIVAHGVKNEKHLRKRLDPILLRRTHIEGLPELIEPAPIKLNTNDPKLKKLFAEEERFLREHGITDIEGLAKLSKVDISQIADVRSRLAIAKIPTLMEMVENDIESDIRPITVYCYHHATLDALKVAFASKFPKLRVAFIDGGVNTKKRHDITKNGFQAGKIDVLCATIGALREGVNLTRGTVVTFIELDYVPANIAQAIKRFHRRGQKNKVYIRKLVFDAGIEKRILKILSDKTDTISKILGD